MFTVPLVIWLCVKRGVRKSIDRANPFSREPAIFMYHCVTAVTCSMLVGFVVNVMQVVKAIVAPRVVLVEQAAKITRGAR